MYPVLIGAYLITVSTVIICGGGNLYYYDGATFEQVTDPDLGVVHDQIWVDGYFMTTMTVSI